MSKHTTRAAAHVAASPIRTVPAPAAFETVTMPELRVGDVVFLDYGDVRAVLDREPVRYPDYPAGEVIAYRARLLDPEAARADGFPVGWCDEEGGAYRWTVQGNGLRRVTREVVA